MTTLAILFLAVVASGALLVIAAAVKGALTRSPFRPRKTDHDKARNLASRTLKRIHP